MAHAMIVGAVRTAVGKKGGALAGVRPDDLLADTLKALVVRVKGRGGADDLAVGPVLTRDVDAHGDRLVRPVRHDDPLADAGSPGAALLRGRSALAGRARGALLTLLATPAATLLGVLAPLLHALGGALVDAARSPPLAAVRGPLALA